MPEYSLEMLEALVMMKGFGLSGLADDVRDEEKIVQN